MTASEVQAAARGLSLSDGVDNLNSRDLSGESGGRTIPRLVGYSSSEKSKNSSNLFVPSGLSTVYCAAFSLDLKKCICNIHGDQIAVRRSSCGSNTLPHSQVILNSTTEIESESNVLTLLRSSDFSGTKDKKRTSPCTSFAAVTLITVASFEEYQAGILDSMLESWCGPKV